MINDLPRYCYHARREQGVSQPKIADALSYLFGYDSQSRMRETVWAFENGMVWFREAINDQNSVYRKVFSAYLRIALPEDKRKEAIAKAKQINPDFELSDLSTFNILEAVNLLDAHKKSQKLAKTQRKDIVDILTNHQDIPGSRFKFPKQTKFEFMK